MSACLPRPIPLHGLNAPKLLYRGLACAWQIVATARTPTKAWADGPAAQSGLAPRTRARPQPAVVTAPPREALLLGPLSWGRSQTSAWVSRRVRVPLGSCLTRHGTAGSAPASSICRAFDGVRSEDGLKKNPGSLAEREPRLIAANHMQAS